MLETEKAIQLLDSEGERYWLPKSQIEYPADATIDSNVIVILPRWLANSNQMEYEEVEEYEEAETVEDYEVDEYPELQFDNFR